MDEHIQVEPPGEPQISDERPAWWRMILEILRTGLLAAVLYLGINSVSARIRVESVSMENILRAGDFVLVNKLAYLFGSPQRGDIVVFDPPITAPAPFIKRVIGLPGETVTVIGTEVYINGQKLDEPYAIYRLGGFKEGTWKVPEGHIFVMGDNRDSSADSRVWGAIPIESVIGKAIMVYWPPAKWGALPQFATAAEGQH